MSDLRFRPGLNGNAVDSSGSGFAREREALRTVVGNQWLTAERSGSELRIKLGLAKELRNGKTRTRACDSVKLVGRATDRRRLVEIHVGRGIW